MTKPQLTTRQLYAWCRIPYDQLVDHPQRKVPFRLCRDSQEMGQLMARELVEEIKTHHARGEKTRAIIPCGPSCWYKPFTDLVNAERVSLRNLVVFHMDECLDWQGRELPRQHPYSFRGFMERHFYAPVAPELVLPIATPPSATSPAVGAAVARAARRLGRRAAGIGSSDLTHYGPRYGFAPVGVGERALEWARQNDARVLELATGLRAAEVVKEAQAQHNACGAGAIAAAIAYAVELGATQGTLLHYTTSHEVMPEGRPTDFVGYGAVAFS